MGRQIAQKRETSGKAGDRTTDSRQVLTKAMTRYPLGLERNRRMIPSGCVAGKASFAMAAPGRVRRRKGLDPTQPPGPPDRRVNHNLRKRDKPLSSPKSPMQRMRSTRWFRCNPVRCSLPIWSTYEKGAGSGPSWRRRHAQVISVTKSPAALFQKKACRPAAGPKGKRACRLMY